MRTKTLLPSLVAAAFALCGVASSSAAAGEQWINGNTQYSYGNSCIILGQPSYQQQVGSYTGYWGNTDTSYPKIGDRFWGHVYYMPTGAGCNFGVHGVKVEISLPAGTQLAIKPNSNDANDKIQCIGTMLSGKQVNLTDQNWVDPNNSSIKGKYCQSTVTSNGANGIVLSYAELGQGQGLDIIFPLVATKKLSGIAEPQNASRMTATVTDSASTSAAQPYQWNYAGDRPVDPDCAAAGQSGASAIGNTSAHTKNFLCNWYRTGKVSLELGEGASGAYGTATQQLNVGGDQATYVDQDWNNLTPGTTYHWRLKFVDDKGTPSTGDDQTYYGPDRTFTTSGTRPVDPPPADPGTGNGGTGGGQTPPPAGGGQNPGGDTGGQNPGNGDGGQKPGDGNGGDTGTKPETTNQQQQQQQQQIQQQQEQQIKDTTAPSLGATFGSVKLRDVLKKGLVANVTCNESCRVNGQLQIDAKTAKKLKLGKKAITIGTGQADAANGRAAVPVKLNAKAAKALKKAKSVKATLVLTATDTSGNAAAPVSKPVTLKR